MTADRPALHSFLTLSASRSPDGTAVIDPTGHSLSYSELDRHSDGVRDYLVSVGVKPGDRVAFCLWKSTDSIVSMYGIMKAGAAYVPLDPSAPASRNAYIAANCGVKALITESSLSESLVAELANTDTVTHLVTLRDREQSSRFESIGSSSVAATVSPNPDDLAYILYTSGSTGTPKGVMITHRNAVSFVDWCSETFEPTPADRFSSHAPLHFDLSIHDVHVCIKHGGTLAIIDEETGKNPMKLARFIAERKISIWYSTPSILALLAEFGRLETLQFPALRMVLFAGEVFPIKHLRAIKRLWAQPRYFNLYGPTETNVCTYLEIPSVVPPERGTPFPIGPACSHYEAKVVNENDQDVVPGTEGELLMHGAAVSPGYWQLPDKTAESRTHDAAGKLWYRTGDIVVEDEHGVYEYRGRRDRMIKKRGYRIELGEIETCLYQHEHIEEVAVVAVAPNDGDTRIVAFYKPVADNRLSLIALKSFCAGRLPAYMVPDGFTALEQLPRTSTDKVDYQSLMRSID